MSLRKRNNYFVHELSDVRSKNIGEFSTFWQYCIVLERASIGNNCNINCHVFIENDVIIGNNVTIKPGVQVWDGLRIQDNVFVGPNVTFTNDDLPRSKKYPAEFFNTYILEGASIGANATIIGGVTIGEYAMVGAGSVVTKDIPKYALVYGNPSRFIGYVCSCGKKLNRNLCCCNCSKQYKEENGNLVMVRSSSDR